MTHRQKRRHACCSLLKPASTCPPGRRGGSCGKDLSRYESLGFTHAPTFHLFCSWKLSATPHTSSAYEAMAAVMAEQQDEDAGLLKANEGLEVGDLREKSKVVKPGFTTSSLPPTCKC